MRVHPELAPELELNDQDKTLAQFMKMGIPTTKLFVNNAASGYKFYQKEKKRIGKFLDEFGKQITSLRVGELSIYLFGKELQFLNGLVNMDSFQAGGFGVGGKFSSAEEMHRVSNQLLETAKQDANFEMDHIPVQFTKLRKLIIDEETGVKLGNLINPFNSYLDTCGRLEHLVFPFSLQVNQLALLASDEPNRVKGMAFSLISGYITVQLEENPGAGTINKIDFRHFHKYADPAVSTDDIISESVQFLYLCSLAVENNVKLYSVAGGWFRSRCYPNVPPECQRAELGTAVISLVHVGREVLSLDLPNLEKIEIREACRCNVLLAPGQKRPEWPALKTLELRMDCRIATQEVRNAGNVGPSSTILLVETKHLYHFFFRGIRRPSLQELRLEFVEGIDDLPVPKAEDIVKSCPNLKKLTIVRWPGTNMALAKLWAGLPNLEEISLDCCANLGNVAFVGENKEEPVFLKLKKLKKFSLKGLDKMPKVTDTLFSLVIRHLSLTHFLVTSESPVASITPRGIQCLLDGPYSKSIAKFPFRDWSLAECTAKEWKNLEKKFRSFDML